MVHTTTTKKYCRYRYSKSIVDTIDVDINNPGNNHQQLNGKSLQVGYIHASKSHVSFTNHEQFKIN